ncbi:MAG: penicillin-binding protein 2 [Candidatus Hydrogenedentota bacterium]
MARQKEPKRYQGVEARVQLLALVMALVFAALLYQFWHLQVVRLAEFREAAETNRVREERLKSGRGIIYGRHNTILADNRAGVDILFVPGEVPEEERAAVASRLATLLDVPAEELHAQLAQYKHAPFTQIPVKRDVSKLDTVRVAERSYDLPGGNTVVHPQRRYLYGETGGQVLGYLGEINPRELEAWDGYHMGDLIGKSGIERIYEQHLHGEDGYAVVTKYARGRPQLRTDRRGMPMVAARDSHGHLLMEEAPRTEPKPGEPLYLTLDIALQAQCEALLKAGANTPGEPRTEGEVGAIVVLDAETGAVLALASQPTYDPSVFVTRGRDRERMELLEARDPNPMRNRGYMEQYPPGSIFKVMLAAAALEEGIITKDTTFFCPGHFKLTPSGRRWHCWKRSGHGRMNVVEALAFSCDVFFYNVGKELGPDRIAKWAHAMGLGIKTGIDLPSEVTGLVPDRAWKRERNADKPVWDQRWYPGETINLSIGQGNCATTPLQNAVMTACIVNGGYRVRPHLNRALGPDNSERLLSDSTLAIVREGMRLCVEKGPPAPSGTGHRAHIPDMHVLGKTGSAQVMALKHHEDYATEDDIPYKFRDHAWFVAGVLDRQPKIAVCVLIEHGHHGSSAASPVAKEVIEFFYANEAAHKNQRALRLAREVRP